MIGKTVHHYRVVRALGRGGMGEVYAAEDTKLHRQVALKFLPQEMAADPERLHRFQREAQAVAALNHPNVVTVYSVEEADGLHFLTMELVEGRTLVDLLPRRGLPFDEFLKLAIPLVDAVGSAHQRGIVHRDLKPANIMVGGDGRLKVLGLRSREAEGGTRCCGGSEPAHDCTPHRGSRLWSSPDPSPDGNLVVFYSRIEPEGDLYIGRSDGTGLRQLTSGPALDRVPHWSPDRVDFDVLEPFGQSPDLENPAGRQRSSTKQTRTIYSGGRDVLGPPRLTRDGRTAFYSRRVNEADVWLMTLQ